MRRGFTLVEMLVASAIFLFGFMTVYSMFLVGVHNRTLADATTRGATVASSVIAEIRLGATNEAASSATTSAWATPSNYIGDGFPDQTDRPGVDRSGTPITDAELVTDPYNDQASFFAHPDQPGMYYRVIAASDLAGNDQPTDGVVLTLVVGQLDSNRPNLTMDFLHQRYNYPSGTDYPSMIDSLVQRGILQRYDAVIHRQVSYRR